MSRSAVNVRGVLLVVGALSMLVVASSYAKFGRRPATPKAATASGTRVPRALGDAPFCDDLAKRYHALWADDVGCEHDEDCVAEPRGGIYTALDGCARFSNRTTPHPRADELVTEWLRAACAWSEAVAVDCGPVAAQCRKRHCVELPPAPLPRDWQRLSLPAVLSVFAPADFRETDDRGIDTYVRVFVGVKRRLTLSLDAYRDPDEAGAPLLLGGFAAVSSRDASATNVTFLDQWSVGFLARGALSVRFKCDDERACADADAIVRSARPLVEP